MEKLSTEGRGSRKVGNGKVINKAACHGPDLVKVADQAGATVPVKYWI